MYTVHGGLLYLLYYGVLPHGDHVGQVQLQTVRVQLTVRQVHPGLHNTPEYLVAWIQGTGNKRHIGFGKDELLLFSIFSVAIE